MKKFLLSGACMAALALAMPMSTEAKLVAHFSMDENYGKIAETVSGDKFNVGGHFVPENVPGAVGQALRFDGYTSYVDAKLGSIIPDGTSAMTVSIWVALPCYPIIRLDTDTSEQTAIATCLDETSKTGFGFYIGFDGRYSFRTYVSGWPVVIEVSDPLPVYQWNNLTAVVDCNAGAATLYNNGTVVGSAKARGSLSFSGGAFKMGRGNADNYLGPFLLTSYNGLIDDISIYDEAMPQSEIASLKPENPANLDIPASRFASDILRPRYHGMPAAAWTNECHGMTYYDGRYHLFFQKNADGPYMARLHWGHISSENLYDWREEKIALAPGKPYDIKGCWSGCVFSDDEITGGKPAILYTAVDYAKATVAGASPLDYSLQDWSKWSGNPIINGRPAGLSDDFRDPYFFRAGDNAYIVVGSSKGGVGTTTLHRYNPSTGKWSNDGSVFYTGKSAPAEGSFWEMPTVTRMPGGKWLFTVTPLGGNQGVRTLYYTGQINSDGTFAPSSEQPKNVELNSRDGFGLLSPTIYQHDGKTIALGIVPDKLSSQSNWNLGWAHCYSLPREWSLDSDGTLIQKPYSGLTGMRGETHYSASGITLNGEMSLSPVSGREVELLGVFNVGQNPFGFRIFNNGTTSGEISYNPVTNTLKADFSRLTRLVNDGGVYDGVYSTILPERLPAGSEMKMNIFIDHSILDIFINDKWATSIRVFPTAIDANGVSVFSDGDVDVDSLNAWVLNPHGGSGINEATADKNLSDGRVNVYSLTGSLLKSNVSPSEAVSGLSKGIYIIGNHKVVVR